MNFLVLCRDILREILQDVSTLFVGISCKNTCIGAKRSTQTFFAQSFSRTLRVMDIRAENRGRLHQKVCVCVCFCGPGDGEKLFDPGASGRKGPECPREIRTEKFMFMLFFLP